MTERKKESPSYGELEEELKADIEDAVYKMRVQAEAKRMYLAESSRIEPVNLTNQWPAPDQIEYLIAGLAPADGYVLIPAERKAGKSTLVLNIIRSLITMPREPFLGEFRVHGRPNVAYFDMEMGWDRVSRWFDKAGLEQGGKLYAESLRRRGRSGRSMCWTTRCAVNWPCRCRTAGPAC